MTGQATCGRSMSTEEHNRIARTARENWAKYYGEKTMTRECRECGRIIPEYQPRVKSCEEGESYHLDCWEIRIARLA